MKAFTHARQRRQRRLGGSAARESAAVRESTAAKRELPERLSLRRGHTFPVRGKKNIVGEREREIDRDVKGGDKEVGVEDACTSRKVVPSLSQRLVSSRVREILCTTSE